MVRRKREEKKRGEDRGGPKMELFSVSGQGGLEQKKEGQDMFPSSYGYTYGEGQGIMNNELLPTAGKDVVLAQLNNTELRKKKGREVGNKPMHPTIFKA